MKTSLTKLKSNFFFAGLLVSGVCLAKPVAQVTEVTGQCFVVNAEGKTSTLKLNDHIEEKSEIMVDEGATITVNDYYDSTYHLTSGSHVKFFDKSVQLKTGKTWIQSQSGKHPLKVTTANGLVDFTRAEFITTFDQTTSRSQFLVVSGDVEVSNVLDKNVKTVVGGGSFTLIDPAVENGVPRMPTKVGLSSLNTAMADFKKLPKKIINSPVAPAAAKAPETILAQAQAQTPAPAPMPERNVASVESAKPKGEIIFMTSNRLPASVHGEAFKYFEKKVVKAPKKTAKTVKEEFVPINFFGTKWSKTEKIPVSDTSPRTPASIHKAEVTTPSAAKHLNLDQEFNDSLKGEMANQPKYSKELEGLIHDLKSY